MATRYDGVAARLMLPLAALAAAAALSGCAVYAPPYAYDAAPVVAPYGPAVVAPYDPYYYPYRYGYPYAYGRPAWAGPPVALNFGYYHGSRHGRYRGPGWHGGPGYRGPGRGGPGWGGPRGGYRGGFGGGRGGGGRGHR